VPNRGILDPVFVEQLYGQGSERFGVSEHPLRRAGGLVKHREDRASLANYLARCLAMLLAPISRQSLTLTSSLSCPSPRALPSPGPPSHLLRWLGPQVFIPWAMLSAIRAANR
jgi:hypothetical protein